MAGCLRTDQRRREQLTSGGKAMRYQPEWSADGKRIAFSDKDGRLFVVTVADKSITEVAQSQGGAIRDYEWSPDGELSGVQHG